jgi:hypothetical protein
LDPVSAEYLLEPTFEPRAFDIGLHHGFRQVGKKSKAMERKQQNSFTEGKLILNIE